MSSKGPDADQTNPINAPIFARTSANSEGNAFPF
jgi:hypothetical protein